MLSTMCDRSMSIVTRWQAKVFFFFSSLSRDGFVLFLFLPDSDVLLRKPKDSCTVVTPKINSTLSLPSLSG